MGDVLFTLRRTLGEKDTDREFAKQIFGQQRLAGRDGFAEELQCGGNGIEPTARGRVQRGESEASLFQRGQVLPDRFHVQPLWLIRWGSVGNADGRWRVVCVQTF